MERGPNFALLRSVPAIRGSQYMKSGVIRELKMREKTAAAKAKKYKDNHLCYLSLITIGVIVVLWIVASL